MEAPERPLTIQVEDDELVIRIGVNILATAFEHMEQAAAFSQRYIVRRPVDFAQDVCYEMRASEAVEVMLDEMMAQALSNGSSAVDAIAAKSE